MSEDSRPLTPNTPRAARTTSAVRTTPVWSCSVTLNTDYAQRVFRRYYDKVRGDLFILTVRTRATGLDEAANVLETMLSEEFGALRKDLQDELARTEALMEKVKLDRVPSYEGALSLQAQYSTPRAKEYLDVIVQMDQLLQNYDALWLTGYIETHARVNRSQNWQRRLIKTANRLRELGNRTKGGIQQEIDRRTQRKGGNEEAAQIAAAEGASGRTDHSTSAVTVDPDHALDSMPVGAEEGNGVDDDLDLLDDGRDVSNGADEAELPTSERDVGSEDELGTHPGNDISHDITGTAGPTDGASDSAKPMNGSGQARRSRRGNSSAMPAGEHGLVS